jgi:hypothetical protein
MTRILTALALATIGITFAACTGHASHQPGGARAVGSSNRQVLVVLRRLAHCVRAHGIPGFPDPVLGRNGVPVFPDSAPRVPSATQQACRTITAQIPANYTSTTPVSATDLRKLLTLARCIRTHGIPDWPDPNALGEFPIDARIEQGGKQLFVPAIHACARLNPDPSGGIRVVRDHS